ncbi:hypothetical protein PoB_007089200 [Plakobranchus ocellatus]|uniref:Uncharacterized protein n=1 Tax=Plakobranchus ocellatus TaxID=259542 RepID=A0AAV4DJD2_9GAST|nr:hypothetical protein PoB_007089200 [Plakobranchus ocellatus]
MVRSHGHRSDIDGAKRMHKKIFSRKRRSSNLQSEIKWNASLASKKAVPVATNCDELRLAGKSQKDEGLRVPILRKEIGGREVDSMSDTGCESCGANKLVKESQLTDESCLLIRIDYKVLLTEKALMPYLCEGFLHPRRHLRCHRWQLRRNECS